MIHPSFERALAYNLARLGLGLNIAVHGLARIRHIGDFALGLRNEFSHTMLPGGLVEFSGYAIVVGEACVGLLILSGLWLRMAYVGGLALMLVLEFGTCLRQEWSTAGLQLTYIAFYSVLLATIEYGKFPSPVSHQPTGV